MQGERTVGTVTATARPHESHVSCWKGKGAVRLSVRHARMYPFAAQCGVFICWGVVLVSVFGTVCVCVCREKLGGGAAEKGDGMSRTWTEGMAAKWGW